MTRTKAQGFCAEPTPVTIRGITYPSQYAAARALGVPQSSITIALNRGDLSGVGMGRNWQRKFAVSVDDVQYETMTLAAMEIGCHCSSVHEVVRKARAMGLRSATVKGRRVEW